MDKEIVLPEIENKTKANLSPFTWSNLKIPVASINQERGKSVSEKRTSQSEKGKEELHLKTIKEQPQEHREGLPRKSKLSKDLGKISKGSEKIAVHPLLTQSIDPRLDNQRYRLKSKGERLNKTIELVRSQQTKMQQTQTQHQPKRIRFLDDKNNMERYLKTNLTRIGWSENSKVSNNTANLIWSNIDKPSDHQELKEGQFYNHLHGSFHLTNKDKLHENLRGKPYYPTSFHIPNEYEKFAKANNQIAAKKMLKTLALEIKSFVNSDNSALQLMQVTLGEILESSIVKMGSEQTIMLVRLCMYVQQLRRSERYRYFQRFQGYKHFNINPKEHFYDSLIQKSLFYLDNNRHQYLSIDYNRIDYRLLVLVLHYHQVFTEHDAFYNDDTALWIVKPIASSRGAGISIIKSMREYCLNPQNMWNQFKNRKKYENKIIQKYIPSPYLLTKPQQLAKRKFDIRQWVLVTSYKSRPIIYKYHTAYCRFSHQTYTLSKLNPQIHLTNYSIFKTAEDNAIASTLMLDDLFSLSAAPDQLRDRYNQQANFIITDSILNARQIKYQDGCFQLFGFDFLLDVNQKLYLLEINLNPACNAERYPKLKEQSEVMTSTMIALITESKPTDKWIKLFGAANSIDSSSETQAERVEMQIKPYYQYELTDDQSLIGLIKYKNRVFNRVFYLVECYLYKMVLSKLQGKQITAQQQVKQQDQEKSNGLIRFIQEKSVSNI